MLYAGKDILRCTSESTVTITGTDIDFENLEKIKYTLDSQDIYMYVHAINSPWVVVSQEKNKLIIKTKPGFTYKVSRVLNGNEGQSVTLSGTTENITQGTVIEKYTSSFPLTEIS